MIPVYQTKTFENDGQTNWRSACFAAILERTLAQTAPLFIVTNGVEADNPAALAAQGYRVQRTPLGPAPQGYAILIGITSQMYPEGGPMAGQPVQHGIVLYNGNTLYNPSPLNPGIIEYLGFDQIIPIS